MYDDIRRSIEEGTRLREKSVTINFQVLTNAERLEGMSGSEFCELMQIEPVWATEFRKMIRLSQYLKQQGLSVK